MWRISDFFFSVKMWFQKVFRGYSDSEIWNLDDTIVEYVLPKLKLFRKQTICYPPNLESFEEWENILDEIIWAFEFHKSDAPFDELKEKYGDNWRDEYRKLNERYRNGLKLFGEYLGCLWW